MQMASGWYRVTVILIWIQSLLIPCVAASFTTILLANVIFLPWTALQQKVSSHQFQCELLNSFNSLYYMFLSFQVLNLWTSGLVSVSWDYRYCLDHGAGNMDENVIVVNVPVDTDNYHEKVSCSKTTLNYASNPAQVTGSICTLQDIQHQQINWNTLCYSFYADWFKRKTNVYYLLWFNSFWIEFGASEWQAVSVNTAAVPQWASFCFTLASLW